MASQKYFETQFMKIQDTLVKRLELVKQEIHEQIKSELDTYSWGYQTHADRGWQNEGKPRGRPEEILRFRN